MAKTTDRSAREWKSPLRKLVDFFEHSRDGWKAKYMAQKEECRLMGNQVRAVEKSRQRWREIAQQAQREVGQLQKELEQYKNCGA
jgi:hypothetical protein